MKKNKLSLSNTTNSSSIDDQLSRIFIGNLNTNKICKKHILKFFSKYGKIKAISMHKGYAFVQFKNKDQAAYAVKEQNGQLVGGQIIDVNLVTDPKPHQKKIAKQIQNLEKNNSSATLSKDDIKTEEVPLKLEEVLLKTEEVPLKIKEDTLEKSFSKIKEDTLKIEENFLKTKEDYSKVKKDSFKNLNNSKCSKPLNDLNFGLKEKNYGETIWLNKLKKPDSLNYLSFSLNSFNNQSSDNSFSHLNHYLSNLNSKSLLIETNSTKNSLPLNEEIYNNFLSKFIQSSNSINQLLFKKDLLICGKCKTIYDDLNLFTSHKSLCALNL